MSAGACCIWIDLDNSPHVQFFRPIVDEFSYVFHGLILYPIFRWKSGFLGSRETLPTGAIYFGSVGFAFTAFQAPPASASLALGLLATLAAALDSVRTLLQLVVRDRLPPALQGILPRVRRYERRRV